MVKIRPDIHHKHHQEMKLGLNRTHCEATPKATSQDKLWTGTPKAKEKEVDQQPPGDAELNMCNITWTEANRAAMNRPRWRTVVDALCPQGDNRIRSVRSNWTCTPLWIVWL